MEWEIDLGNGKTMKYDGRVGLHLSGCTTLTSLPNGLKVAGCLDLTDCTALTRLPNGLEVDAFLTLDGCTSLHSLPKDLVVKQWLYISGLHRLYIPKTVFCRVIFKDSDQYFICRDKPGRFRDRPTDSDCILVKEGDD